MQSYSQLITKLSFLFACVVVVTLNCNKESSTKSQTNPNDSDDIMIDNSYLEPKGGDPRGYYATNNPFVMYWGSGTLMGDEGRGTIVIKGNSAGAGTFQTNNYGASVHLETDSCIMATYPYSNNIKGNWSVDGKYFILTKEGNAEKDTILFTSDSKGFYLISPIFKNGPPFLSFPYNSNDDDPTICNDSTIWIFKR